MDGCSFLRLLLAGGGITMDSEWGARHFHGSSSPMCSGAGEVGKSFLNTLAEGHTPLAL